MLPISTRARHRRIHGIGRRWRNWSASLMRADQLGGSDSRFVRPALLGDCRTALALLRSSDEGHRRKSARLASRGSESLRLRKKTMQPTRPLTTLRILSYSCCNSPFSRSRNLFLIGKPKQYIDEAITFLGAKTTDKPLNCVRARLEYCLHDLTWILYALADPKTPFCEISEVFG